MCVCDRTERTGGLIRVCVCVTVCDSSKLRLHAVYMYTWQKPACSITITVTTCNQIIRHVLTPVISKIYISSMVSVYVKCKRGSVTGILVLNLKMVLSHSKTRVGKDYSELG